MIVCFEMLQQRSTVFVRMSIGRFQPNTHCSLRNFEIFQNGHVVK